MIGTIIAVIVTAAIAVPVSLALSNSYHRKKDEQKIGGAEEEARKILDKAVKDGEDRKREILLEAKEEALKTKNEIDKEVRERRAEVQKSEARVMQKEENLDRKLENADKREAALVAKEEKLTKQRAEVDKMSKKRVQELERISGLTSEQAKDFLLKTLEEDVKLDEAKIIKEAENEAREEADKKAKEIVVNAIQRCSVDHVAESTISVVQLPSDDMKGRIIGREGRNIRTLETLTGVELIIDDTPEAVVLSSFDPLRREIARITLETLIKDGRIHPTRIEEIYDKTCKDMNKKIVELGNEALFTLGLTKMDSNLIELVGKLHFRTSFGQNVLSHSIEVAELSGLLASEFNEDVNLAKRAGLLHDIGKAIDHDVEGSHVEIGADLARKYHENDVVINTIESHHGDKPATSVIASIVAISDALSASRPGARNDSIENYVQRLSQLESVGNDVEGVEKTFAVQAGRELRVIVKPEEIDDLQAHVVAREIKEKIESTMKYPGTIKITVVRETRALEEAK